MELINPTTLHIAVTGSLTTSDVETLIADLAEMRARMTPGVPLTPTPQEGAASANVSLQRDPYAAVRLLRNGDVRVWLRNAGIGWMAFDLPPKKAAYLRDGLAHFTGDVKPDSGLFEESRTDRGHSH